MVQVVKPASKSPVKIFLAGTIDNGQSIDWQADMTSVITSWFDKEKRPITIYNPRRDDWDEKWKSGNPELIAQINWELKAMEYCDLIIMKFLPNSQSPITLLELGLFKDKNLLVNAPMSFYRYDNVYLTCKKYGIKFSSELPEFNTMIHTAITKLMKK